MIEVVGQALGHFRKELRDQVEQMIEEQRGRQGSSPMPART